MATATIERKWNGKDVKIRGNRVVNKSAFEIGLIVEAQAKLLAPVKFGLLRGSYTTQQVGKGSKPEAPATSAEVIRPPTDDNEVLVGTAVEYAPYVEFGTNNALAQPHLRPARDLAQGRALTIVKNEGRFEFREYLK